MLKWKLMVSTLPVVLALLGLKLFLEHVLGFEGLIDFSDVGIILTSGVFLIGFLLAGTMADYKEAEKLPADLSCTLETIEEIFVLAATDRPDLDLASLRRRAPALQYVAHNGGESARTMKLVAALGYTVLKLPSTSPANASWSFERKRAAWMAAFEQAGI